MVHGDLGVFFVLKIILYLPNVKIFIHNSAVRQHGTWGLGCVFFVKNNNLSTKSKIVYTFFLEMRQEVTKATWSKSRAVNLTSCLQSKQ